MSSMRNFVSRRTHKERAQPQERQKYGLLEKRKDYKLRAADHRQKKTKIKALQSKARERNPDEFSFKMMSSNTDNTGRRVQDRGNKALSMDVVKLLKTQDAGYIRTMLQMVRKEREELEQRIRLEGNEVRTLKNGYERKKGKHTVFVDDREEQKNFKADEWFVKGGELQGRLKKDRSDIDEWDDDDEPGEAQRKRLSKKQQEMQLLAEKEKVAVLKKREQTQDKVAGYLETLKNRERELVTAEEELEKQRARMSNSIGGVNKYGVKFKIRERKR